MDGLGSLDSFVFEGLRFDRASGGLVRTNGSGVAAPIVLGSRALAVLALLVERQGQVVSKDEIFAVVWPGIVVGEGNLTVQISVLRRVLDHGRTQGSCIQTIPGRGYRFVAAVTRGGAVAAPGAHGLGDGSGVLLAADDQPEPRSAESGTDAVLPTPVARKFYRFRRAVVTAVVGTLCLAATATGVYWHWFSARQNGLAPRLSIVVLPFANLSNDPDQQYLADGITEELTTDLSRIAHMFVISAGTAFTYRDKPIDARQIGQELGVRYLLEGSVQRSGGRVRLNAQLIDGRTAAHLWAERFDSDTSDLFALQDEITRQVAASLKARLIAVEARRPVEKPDALDYILRGLAVQLDPPGADVHAKAISMFEQALTVDPDSVEAKVRLANRLAFRVGDDTSTSRKSDIVRAETLIDQALAASPGSLLAHFTKAQLLRAQFRCAEAIPEYEMVIASNPNFAAAYAALGRCKLSEGSIDETIPLEEKAIQLSPRDPAIGIWFWRIGVVHLLQSRTDEAVRWFEKACAATPALPIPHAYLAAALALRGEYERAAAEGGEARRLLGENSSSSISKVRAGGYYRSLSPEIRALYEATYLAGLRKAGMPEE